jgi:hypothetical protein
MKKIIYTLLALAAISQLRAQVGIGTETPHSSSILELNTSEKGFLLPSMTSTQRNAISAPATGLQVYDSETNSIWYFNGSYWVNTIAMASIGDIKSGIQINDHSGWVLLDGRAISTLTPNQQAAAAALGLTGNLPNANNAYLSQNGSPIATLSGSNTATLTQANLPNVTFSGTAASAGGHNHSGTTGDAGSHTHTGTTTTNGSHNHTGNTTSNGNHSHQLNMVSKDDGNFSNEPGQFPTGDANKFNGNNHNINTEDSGNHSHTLNINNAGDHSHSLSINSVGNHSHNFTTSTVGDHTHTVTVSSGGTASPFNIAPRTLSVNMFIYLGL